MSGFVFDSEEFRRELRDSPHHAGEVEFLKSILSPGMRVIEAGSNRGVTAVAIAKQIGSEGHLYAFEPVPEFYAELKENLLRNDVKNASAHPLALGNRRGRVLEATTVTDFLAEEGDDRLDVLNLDCEGSELLVLQGAGPVLEKHHPQIFCEIHRDYLGKLGQSAGEVAGLLDELGYRVRPLRVEDLEAESNIEDCSHIYARKPQREGEIEDLKRKIADLKARIPIHSVKPSMMQELEDLEERLAAAQKDTRP